MKIIWWIPARMKLYFGYIVSTGFCKLLLSSCVLLFFFFLFLFLLLEVRPAPELIGLWSRLNSRAHTAWQLPPGWRGYSANLLSQRPPQLYLTPPLLCERGVSLETSEIYAVWSGLFHVFYLFVLGLEEELLRPVTIWQHFANENDFSPSKGLRTINIINQSTF